MSRFKMIDIGANLTDPMFRGVYNSSQKHSRDLNQVLKRSFEAGVDKIIITGGSLSESREALDIAKTNDNLYSTVGCHPTRCTEFTNYKDGPDEYIKELKKLTATNKAKVVAFGEMGLDYDRLQWCNKDIQTQYFKKQLTMAREVQLPLFLHNRNSSEDFFKILHDFKDCIPKRGGVVHSFDGNEQDIKNIISLNLSIGINGCSLKTKDNLEMLKLIPLDKLLIETDCPWCGIKQSHESSKYVITSQKSCKKEKYDENLPVKDRNEPSNLIQVLEVISKVTNQDIEKLSIQIYQNTMNLFF